MGSGLKEPLPCRTSGWISCYKSIYPSSCLSILLHPPPSAYGHPGLLGLILILQFPSLISTVSSWKNSPPQSPHHPGWWSAMALQGKILTGRPGAICGQRYLLPCFAWLWIWLRGSRATTPKGTKSARTQEDYRSIVHLSIYPFIHLSAPWPYKAYKASDAKTARNSKMWRTDLPTDMARCRVACPRLTIKVANADREKS